MRRTLLAAAAAMAIALTPGVGAAQVTTSTAQVTALVIGSPINFLSVRNLDFATVTRGIPKSVAYTAPAAAKVQLGGSSNAFAQITFTLPTQLPNIQAVPGINMPITFGAGSAAWNRDQDNVGAATAFNPASPTVGRFGPPPRPWLWIYLGGTVNPSPTQAPGIYQGTIILTITYL